MISWFIHEIILHGAESYLKKKRKGNFNIDFWSRVWLVKWFSTMPSSSNIYIYKEHQNNLIKRVDTSPIIISKFHICFNFTGKKIMVHYFPLYSTLTPLLSTLW